MWRHRGDVNLPLLATVGSVDISGPLDSAAAPHGEMDTFVFEARPGKGVEYVGVAAIKGKVPDAYLIYFRHTINMDKDFQGEHKLLETGIGDYLIGRMQACRQVMNSGKNVAVVLPVGKSGPGKFASDAGFVEQCLTDINDELFNAATPPPLLLACNSYGIMQTWDLFLRKCKQLVGRVKAVYDFDGSLVEPDGITLFNAGGAGCSGITRARTAGGPQGPGPIRSTSRCRSIGGRGTSTTPLLAGGARLPEDKNTVNDNIDQLDKQIQRLVAPIRPDLHAAARAGEHRRHLTTMSPARGRVLVRCIRAFSRHRSDRDTLHRLNRELRVFSVGRADA